MPIKRDSTIARQGLQTAAMYTFEVSRMFGSPETVIHADDVLVEIDRFVPQESSIYDYSLSHHLLMSWMYPLPAMGQCSFDMRGTSKQFNDVGDLVFVPAESQAKIRYLPGAGSHRAIAIRFAPEMLDHLYEDMACRHDPLSMASHNLRNPDIRQGMRLLVRELLAPGFASSVMVESIGQSLLVYLVRHFDQLDNFKANRGKLAPWQLRKINERIEDQEISHPLPTLKELAELAGISTGYLRRAYKQSAGCTIAEHIRNVRLERARMLLTGTDLTLKEIASQLGFAAQYSFTLAFQRDTGETPKAYRQQRRSPHLG